MFVTSHFLPEETAVFTQSVIHLYLMHHVRWQIVKHDFVVSSEEVFTIKKQTLNKLSIDIYPAILA